VVFVTETTGGEVIYAGLDGPSKTIIVEPVTVPQVEPTEVPAVEPEREKEPVGV
jgi:hypothetical protein